MSAAVYLAIPLPPFSRWRVLTDADDCPDAHVVIAALGQRRSRISSSDKLRLPDDLRELLRLYSSLGVEARTGLVAYARELAAQVQPLYPLGERKAAT